jgi:hypothetical protein
MFCISHILTHPMSHMRPVNEQFNFTLSAQYSKASILLSSKGPKKGPTHKIEVVKIERPMARTPKMGPRNYFTISDS